MYITGSFDREHLRGILSPRRMQSSKIVSSGAPFFLAALMAGDLLSETHPAEQFLKAGIVAQWIEDRINFESEHGVRMFGVRFL